MKNKKLFLVILAAALTLGMLSCDNDTSENYVPDPDLPPASFALNEFFNLPVSDEIRFNAYRGNEFFFRENSTASPPVRNWHWTRSGTDSFQLIEHDKMPFPPTPSNALPPAGQNGLAGALRLTSSNSFVERRFTAITREVTPLFTLSIDVSFRDQEAAAASVFYTIRLSGVDIFRVHGDGSITSADGTVTLLGANNTTDWHRINAVIDLRRNRNTISYYVNNQPIDGTSTIVFPADGVNAVRIAGPANAINGTLMFDNVRVWINGGTEEEPGTRLPLVNNAVQLAPFVVPSLPFNQTALYAFNNTDPAFRFDFSFGWTTDAQNIVRRRPHLNDEVIRWLAKNKEALDLRYVFNTGDLVTGVGSDINHRTWRDSSAAHDHLDRAGIPNSVIPGNHDWGGNPRFASWHNWFGANRYRNGVYWNSSNNDWFREDWDNNIGHYVLITAGGVDFVMVHMGTLAWTNDGSPGTASGAPAGAVESDTAELKKRTAWINEVFQRYPDRVGMLMMHQYLTSSVGSGSANPAGSGRLWKGTWFWENVVIPNENIFMVFCGHALGTWNRRIADTQATLNTDNSQTTHSLVDNRLQPGRIVHEIMFNYQGSEVPDGNGGHNRYRRDMWGMIRVLFFDMQAEKIHFRTYSPINDSIDIFDNQSVTPVVRTRDNFSIDFSPALGTR